VVQKANITREEAKKWQRLDPYGWQQLQQRKAAFREQKKEKEQIAVIKKGNPVLGVDSPTPYVESFDSAGQAALSKAKVDEDGNIIGEQHDLPTSPHILNHMLTQEELDEHLIYAKALTKPLKRSSRVDMNKSSEWGDATSSEKQQREHEKSEREREQQHEWGHKRASEALRRIMDLNNAGGKLRRHANVRRCVEEFGRHNTDKTLKPTPKSRDVPTYGMPARCGPDTGSSEVQIAILTAKIRSLTLAFDKPKGKKDKANKRNLRLLVHRRQKLLKYMKRKEGDSDRWNNMIKKLGITPACWEGEIVVV
jgi:ribosomal protein S15